MLLPACSAAAVRARRPGQRRRSPLPAGAGTSWSTASVKGPARPWERTLLKTSRFLSVCYREAWLLGPDRPSCMHSFIQYGFCLSNSCFSCVGHFSDIDMWQRNVLYTFKATLICAIRSITHPPTPMIGTHFACLHLTVTFGCKCKGKPGIQGITGGPKFLY